MTFEQQIENAALMLSQLSGSPLHRVIQLSALVAEFIARMTGFADLSRISVSHLASSDVYETIKIGADIMEAELRQLELDRLRRLEPWWRSFQNELAAFRGNPTRESLARAETAYLAFRTRLLDD